MGRTSYQSVYGGPGTVVSCWGCEAAACRRFRELPRNVTANSPPPPPNPRPPGCFPLQPKADRFRVGGQCRPGGLCRRRPRALARGLRAEARANRCAPSPGAAEPPAAGAGVRPSHRAETGPPGLCRGLRRGRACELRLSSPLLTFQASSARGAPDAAYSAAGFEVWASARLGPGSQGGRMGGRKRGEPAQPPTHTVPRHPGDVAAPLPLVWEPRAVRRARGSGWRSPETASCPAEPLPSAVRPRQGPREPPAPHSPPGGAGTRRARPPSQRNELSTAALGAARGHARIWRRAGNQGGTRPWGGIGADDGTEPS